MDRRAFLGSLTGGLLARPLAAGAQPAGKIARIGFLSPATASDPQMQGLVDAAAAWGSSATWKGERS